MKEKSAYHAALKGKCPRCRTGDMFRYPAYKISGLGKMHKRCGTCELSFEPEPGFYYGAMYVSYAFSVAIFLVTSFVVYFAAGDPEIEWYFGAVTLVALLLYPLNFRYSRILFFHVFGGAKYDPTRIKI